MMRRAFARSSRCFSTQMKSLPGNMPLKEADPVMYELIQEEHQRQLSGIEMIASENFTSRAVMECLGSVLTNKYAEGLPGARFVSAASEFHENRNCKHMMISLLWLLFRTVRSAPIPWSQY